MEQRLIDAEEVLEVTKSYKNELGRLKADTFVKLGVKQVEEFIQDESIIPTILTIPENPTNGDMIKAIFPNLEMWGKSKNTLDYSLGGMIHRVLKSWWNAPYKKESD